MRLLVIAPQPFFSPRGTPLSVYYRVLVLSELGAEIDLLTYGEGRDVRIPRVRTVRIPRFRWLGNVRIGPSLLKLFLDQFMLIWTIGMLVRNQYQAVYAHEESVFWCAILKPLFRMKLIYEMHSSLPQQLGNFGYPDSSLVRRLFERLEAHALRTADGVITICPDLAAQVLRLAPDTRHELIENSLHEAVKLDDRVAHAAPHGCPNAGALSRPLLVYAGTLEAYQGIELLIDAMPQVCAAAPRASLLIIGGTADQVAAYRARAEAQSIAGSCVLTGQLDKPQADACLEEADVVLSPRISGTNTPLKIYQLLASGKPMVATRIESHTQILDEGTAFLAEPDAASLAEAILEALQDTAEADRRAAAAKELYEDRYSRRVYVAKMRQMLQMIGALP